MTIEKNSQICVVVNENNINHQYSLVTNKIEVKARPEYIDSQFGTLNSLYIWAYHIRIENKSNKVIQLLSRYWRIVDEKGNIQEVVGEGVIGEKPLIAPMSHFEYSSGVHLRYPSGIMSGYYEIKDEDNKKSKVMIPSFSLDIGTIKATLN